MKYLKHFDYIIENMSQARKILKDKGISKDDKRFKEITDKTKKDGYTGFITKLVFEFGMNLEGALSMYDELKKYKIDLGTPKIKEILDDKGMPNSNKIQHIVNLIRNAKVDTEPAKYELIFNSNGFNVYLIEDYKGILCTGSPAWCLKTKSFWNQYTKQNRGTQFVIIDSRLVGENDEFDLTVPNNWDGTHYSKTGWESTRYGVTIYPSGRMDVFDDGNTQSMVKFTEDGELEVTRGTLPIFAQRVLKELHTYFMEKIQPHIPNIIDEPDEPQENIDARRIARQEREWTGTPEFDIENPTYDGFGDFMDEIREHVDGANTSFNYTVEFHSFNTEQVYAEFINAIKIGMGVNTKEEIFAFMDRYKNRILGDHHFTEVSGIFDIFLNEFLAWEFENNPNEGELENLVLSEFPTVTKHAIPLGGYYIDEQGIGEVVMKYHYGFQYEKYGKAAILQAFDTLTNYYGEMANNFYDILTEGELIYIELPYFDLDAVPHNDNNLLSVEPYNDGFKVTIDFEELLKYKDPGYDRSKAQLRGDIIDSLNPWFENSFVKDGNIVVPIYSNPVREEE